MTYLESFNFPDKYAEEDFSLSLLSTYHDIWYQFGVLSNHKIEFITSDDVFDFMINLRFINEGVDNERESLLQEYTGLKHSEFRLKSISDYDQLKRSIKAKKINKIRICKTNCKILQGFTNANF